MADQVRDELATALRASPLFGDCSAEAFREIRADVRGFRAARGETIYNQHDPAGIFYVILGLREGVPDHGA